MMAITIASVESVRQFKRIRQRMRISSFLTLVAVAEIKTRELPRTLRVVLGVGVPFKRFGKEQAKLVAYLKQVVRILLSSKRRIMS